MGLFGKKEKKLRHELGKSNVRLCKETLKEIEELYDDLKSAYDGLDTLASDFRQFSETASRELQEKDREKMKVFSSGIEKADKLARNAIRDVHDLLRNQKKRIKEASNEL